ncbi:hypothetical protein T11_1792, partial [Trichinella zimbabwensis]
LQPHKAYRFSFGVTNASGLEPKEGFITTSTVNSHIFTGDRYLEQEVNSVKKKESMG